MLKYNYWASVARILSAKPSGVAYVTIKDGLIGFDKPKSKAIKIDLPWRGNGRDLLRLISEREKA